MHTLTAIPVHNEQEHVAEVLEQVLEHTDHVLVVDDGSTDATPDEIRQFPVRTATHDANQGYGAALQTAFRTAHELGAEWLITLDCDHQHEPAAIPYFIDAARTNDADILSGSRYLVTLPADDAPPPERRRINQTITAELNQRLRLGITDAFCGFKAFRVRSLRQLNLSENGYAFPMQHWVQAAANHHRVREIPVRLIYNDPNRTFGDNLDDADIRLHHYRCAMHRELERFAHKLPERATADLLERASCCP